MRCSTIALIGFIYLAWSGVSAEDTKVFPNANWGSWLQIEYPAEFEVDPKSFQGERKWWGKIDDPDSELSIQVSAFGYVSDLDLLLTVPGADPKNYIAELGASGKSIEEKIQEDAEHKNVGDYFKAKILPEGCDVSVFGGYQRFIHKKKDRVVVYYLRDGAFTETYGRCYQVLTFTFPEGEYSKHQKTIESIIVSAKPPFGKASEQDAAPQIRPR